MPKSCVAVNCTNHNFITEKKLTFHILTACIVTYYKIILLIKKTDAEKETYPAIQS